MELLLGNRNYSSWSMRAGVVALAFDLQVDTTMIWLDEPDAAQSKRQRSPAGRVPILEDGDLTIWDSLAICEYLAELQPLEEIILRMRLGDHTQNRLTLLFEYYRLREGKEELVARGEQEVACMLRDGERLRPAPIPPPLQAALRPYGLGS